MTLSVKTATSPPDWRAAITLCMELGPWDGTLLVRSSGVARPTLPHPGSFNCFFPMAFS